MRGGGRCALLPFMWEAAAERPEGAQAALHCLPLNERAAAERRAPPVACGDTLPVKGKEGAPYFGKLA